MEARGPPNSVGFAVVSRFVLPGANDGRAMEPAGAVVVAWPRQQ